jgi:DNA repair and recombination RAD54-like protein
MKGAEWDDEDSASEPEAEPSDCEPSSPEDSDADESMEDEVADEEEAGEDGAGAAAERPATQAELQERRQQNIHALVSGAGLALKRTSLMPRLGLTVQQAAVVLRRPFKSPHPTAPAVSDALRRKLVARKAFVPWGGGAFVPLKLKVPPRELLGLPQDAAGLGAASPAPAAEPAVVLPPGVEPLVLWEPPAGEQGQPVRVDDMLTQFLRPHQREGVQFMFECVTGLRSFAGQGGRGGRGRLRQRAWRINKGQPRPPCSRLDSNLSL